MEDIINFKFNGFTLDINIWIILIVIIAAIPILWRYFREKWYKNIDIVELDIKLGGVGNVKIKPGYEVVRVAYKAWVELSTRKAVLPFDEQNDIIAEVYDSWYELFKEMRGLIKEIPAERIRADRDTRELVQVLVKTLNMGLRPHLTKWQGKFRKWYECELKKEEESSGKKRSPQEIQRNFPEYEELKNELNTISDDMQEYVNELEKILHMDSK